MQENMACIAHYRDIIYFLFNVQVNQNPKTAWLGRQGRYIATMSLAVMPLTYMKIINPEVNCF